MSAQHPVEGNLAIIGAEITADFRRGHAAIAEIIEAPDIIGGMFLPQDDAVVPLQIGQLLRRAMSCEVIRCGDDKAAIAQQHPGDQTTCSGHAKPDVQINACLDQIERCITEHQLYLKFRVPTGEARDGRGDILPTEIQRCIDPQQAGRLFGGFLHVVFEGFDLAQYPRGMAEIGLALAGQTDPPGSAVHQAHTEAILEFGQTAADGGAGNAQLPSGVDKAFLPRQHNEETEITFRHN